MPKKGWTLPYLLSRKKIIDNMSFLHNTLSEVNFPAPGGCAQLGQAGAVLSSTTRMI